MAADRCLRCRSARSRSITLSTRSPSWTARRLLTPWMRSNSWLGTSWTRNPALTTRMFIRVSISNPAQSSAISSRHRFQKAL